MPRFRFFASLVVIPFLSAAPALAQWTTTPVTAPRVQYRTFQSAAANTTVSFHIYTPPAYDLQPTRRFPVLYWLHGSGSATAGIAPMSGWFSNAMALGLLPPMIIVFPNGMPFGMYCDAADGSTPIETVIINELIPHVDANFRTIAAPKGRILEGFSMGGYGTGRLGIRHSALFCGISMLAAGPMQLDFPNAPPDAHVPPARRDMIFEDVWNNDPALVVAANPTTLATLHAPALASNNVLFRIAVGGDDSVLPPNIDFHNHLLTLGVAHTFNIYPGIGHETIPLLSAIGPSNWSFYLDALTPSCDAVDINQSGDITVEDLFAFLNAWFASEPSADFDGADGITPSDIFAFLNAWFAGC
ncbi:MAG: esterase family protein [Phycisphaerales bacterium]|nr:esterase family protein [Phycisphaerales bacterium]